MDALYFCCAFLCQRRMAAATYHMLQAKFCCGWNSDLYSYCCTHMIILAQHNSIHTGMHVDVYSCSDVPGITYVSQCQMSIAACKLKTCKLHVLVNSVNLPHTTLTRRGTSTTGPPSTKLLKVETTGNSSVHLHGIFREIPRRSGAEVSCDG